MKNKNESSKKLTLSEDDLKQVFAYMDIIRRFSPTCNDSLHDKAICELAKRRMWGILEKDIDDKFRKWLFYKNGAKYPWSCWLKEKTSDGPGLTKSEVKDCAYEVIGYVAVHFDESEGDFEKYFHDCLRFKWHKACAKEIYGNRTITVFDVPSTQLKGLSEAERKEVRKKYRESLKAEQKYLLCENALFNDPNSEFSEYRKALESSNAGLFVGEFSTNPEINDIEERSINWDAIEELIHKKDVKNSKVALDYKELELSYINYLRSCLSKRDNPTNQGFVDFLKETKAKVQRKDKDITTEVTKALIKDLSEANLPWENFLKKNEKNSRSS